MKKWSRLTALVLAFAIVLSTVSGALAQIEIDHGEFQTWVADTKEAEGLSGVISIDEGGEVLVAPSTFTGELNQGPLYTSESTQNLNAYAQGSAPTVDVALGQYSKVELAAPSAGQWQVYLSAADLWVNITGETGSTFALTYAKVQSLFNANGAAKVRCLMGDRVTETVNVTVRYEDAAVVVNSTATVSQPMVMSARTVAADADDSDPEKVIIEIAYQYQSGESVATSYTAEIEKGGDLTTSVITLPVVTGYVPGSVTPEVPAFDLNAGTIQLSLSNVTENQTYVVTYVPTYVDFKVEHYLMGFDSEQSTAELTDTDTYQNFKKTGEAVGDGLAKEYEGFTPLWYNATTKVAADGSTIVEIYYERNWYLMLFELDGGYGVEPIYAQYGADVDVGTPTKPGYSFKGWNPKVPDTVPAGNYTYVAMWEVGEPVNYTVVYWKENADDTNYSFWGQVTKTATAGSVVSGSDDIPTSITNATINGATVNEKRYFTYNAARTDTDVIIAGDGSTVVNVYYYRNTYNIYFDGISGTCAIPEHTHGTDCNSYLDCVKDEHTHGEDCERVLSCKQEVHEHTDECSKLTCELPVHNEHTDDCLICTKTVHEAHGEDCCILTPHTHDEKCCTLTPHTHSESCCTTTEHTHSDACCRRGGTSYNHWWHSDSCCKENLTEHTHGDGNCTYDHYAHSHGDGSCTCDLTVHVHGGSTCTCSTEIHYHSQDQGCYSDIIHSHGTDCYQLVCGKAVHNHNDACYTYTCGGEEHTHTDSCYRPCTKKEHTHNNNCNNNRTDNVIYVVTAKYQQNIADVWPTAEDFPNINFNGWSIDDINNEAVSKRVNMTSDLCDTNDGVKYATGDTGGTKQTLYYMFESFDQTSGTSGDSRRSLSGKYYDSDSDYYQVVNSGSTDWGQKPIDGMAPVSKGVKYESNYTKVFLYYTRNRSNLMYHNVNGVVKTVSSIMYEQPLKEYKDSSGNLLSAYTPPYPSTLEANAYYFEGWYTTPECYENTEFDFNTATMPNGDLTLYAHWVPVNHTVKVYPTEDDMNADTNQIGDTVTVPHGSKVPEASIPADPTNGNYTFVGWFYKVTVTNEDGTTTEVEKAFDFKNMPVRRDLKIYAKWNSTQPVGFRINYVLATLVDGVAKPVDANGNVIADDVENPQYVYVADSLISEALDGTTITEEAKTGNDLYAEYRTGYFPYPPSHSVVIEVESDNVYNFLYVPANKVPYKVVYLLDNGDGTYTQHSEVLREDNTNTVVTENYIRIPGYMPDKYQKRLIVTYPGVIVDNGNNETDAELGENIIFFYYIKDEVNAYWTVSHFIEPIGGVTADAPWQQYGITESQTGTIDSEYTAAEKNIEGFIPSKELHKVDLFDENGVKTTQATDLTETLPKGGMDFRLYYVRDEYPVKVQYLEQNTNAVLADPELYNKGATYDYQSQVSVSTDKTFYGYELVSANPDVLQSVQVDGKTLDTVTKNVITFYYKKTEVEINYIGVGPDGNLIDTAEEKQKIGSVTVESEPGIDGVVTALDGPVGGSIATPVEPTYKFVGWFTDAACTTPVIAGWVEGTKLVPQKQDDDNVAATAAIYVGATYYAKFDWNVSTLTITKTVAKANQTQTDDIPDDASFTFTVKLPEGEYDYTKTSAASVETTDKLVIGTNGEGTVTLGNNERIVIEGVVITSDYEVVETVPAYYTLDTTKTSGTLGKIQPNGASVASFTNTYTKYKIGSLDLIKQVKDSTFTEGSKSFTFTVTLNDASVVQKQQFGEWMTANNATVTRVNDTSFTVNVAVNATATDKTATVTLSDLPIGSYTVTETLEESDPYKQDYASENGTVTVVADDPATEAVEKVDVKIINTAEDVITVPVEKLWVDDRNFSGDRPDETGIVINLVGKVNNEEYAHGVQPITLTAQNVDANNTDKWCGVFQNVPKFDGEGVEIVYTITENTVAKYTASEPVEITVDGVKVWQITNTIIPGKLTITKSGMELKESAIFTVEGDNQTFTVVLQNNGSATIAGLKPGATFTVTENASWSKFYSDAGSKTAKIGSDETVTVSFENKKDDQWLHDEDFKKNVFGNE